MKKIKKISKIRHKNFERYKKNLKDFWNQNSNLELISSFGFATFVKNRLQVFKYLKSKKIQSRPLICKHGSATILVKNKNKPSLPNAEFIDKYGIYLPNHANLSSKDIDFICKNFKNTPDQFIFNKC